MAMIVVLSFLFHIHALQNQYYQQCMRLIFVSVAGSIFVVQMYMTLVSVIS